LHIRNQWFAAQRHYVHKTSFLENRRDTKVVCPVMWTYDILTPAHTMAIIDKITIFCNDVNKTSTSVELLAINILRYMS